MATVRQQGARRLGVIIVLVLGGGVATAAVRAGSNTSKPIHTAQAPTTSATEGETATSAETTVPTTPEATAGGSSTGSAVGTGGSSGLSSSGSGAAATSEHPNTGGPLPLLPGLGAVAAGAALRRRRH